MSVTPQLILLPMPPSCISTYFLYECKRLKCFICIQRSHPADSNMGNRIYWSQIYWDAKKERNGIPYFLFSSTIVKFDASLTVKHAWTTLHCVRIPAPDSFSCRGRGWPPPHDWCQPLELLRIKFTARVKSGLLLSKPSDPQLSPTSFCGPAW